MPDTANLYFLASVEQIKLLKARYFRFMDTKQWAAWRDLFTGDLCATFDVAPGGPTIDLGRTRDAVVEAVAERLSDAITVHHGYSSEIVLTSPETATGIWAMGDIVEHARASHYPSIVGMGHYHEEYRKGGDGHWRISRFHLTRLRVDPWNPKNVNQWPLCDDL